LRASHRQPREEDPLTPERLERENERLSREVERLRQELIERDKRIFELERKLALRLQNSTTTSKPPPRMGWRASNGYGVGAARRVGVNQAASRVIAATGVDWRR